MDEMIDEIIAAFQSDSLEDKFEYIKLYYEYALTLKVSTLWTDIGVDYDELMALTLEYQAENSVVESDSMDSSLTKTVSDTVDTPD